MRFFVLLFLGFCLTPLAAAAQTAQPARKNDPCAQPIDGTILPEPADLRSENGVLKVQLTYTSFRDAHGQTRYCYRDQNGSQAPNLRLHPGDWLVLTLKNDVNAAADSDKVPHDHAAPSTGACGNGAMDAFSTNLHFHGLYVPPVCHQDDVLNTFISPSEPAFEYRLQVPADQPPGVYWYHPHVHGFSNAQVQGGASGALIVEGIECANPAVAGLPERVLIIRDQPVISPNAVQSASMVMPQIPILRDPDGDILNTGTGYGPPSKDLSINFVAVPYPDYPPALILTKPGERQLWRVLNASAITYLDLRLLFNGVPQPVGQVSLDGVPLNAHNTAGDKGPDNDGILWLNNVELPPGARADLIVKGPPAGVYGNLITQAVDTGPAGENDPVRPLANIIATLKAPAPRSTLPAAPKVRTKQDATWLGDVKPARVRRMFFSERPSDPANPNSPTVFMLTVEGHKEAPYDANSTEPNLTVTVGDVEDWIIENRSKELHAFHIHQLHFLLEEVNGQPVAEPFLRDIVNVGYWNGTDAKYPSVRLRMDFRNPNIAGTFVYHCHLLEHEDGGMMGTVRVTPK